MHRKILFIIMLNIMDQWC